MGDVMGDLNHRRGKILGMEQDGGKTKVRALVPLAELDMYATTLRSLTQGFTLASTPATRKRPRISHRRSSSRPRRRRKKSTLDFAITAMRR
jgi:hypothetical protein